MSKDWGTPRSAELTRDYACPYTPSKAGASPISESSIPSIRRGLHVCCVVGKKERRSELSALWRRELDVVHGAEQPPHSAPKNVPVVARFGDPQTGCGDSRPC